MRLRRNNSTVALLLFLSLAVSLNIAMIGCGSSGEAEVLGSVNDSLITYEMIEYIFDKNPKNKDLPPDEKYNTQKTILDDLLGNQLFAIEAYKNKMYTNKRFSRKLEDRRQMIAGDLYHNDYIYNLSELSDEDIKAIYEKFGVTDETDPDTIQVLKNRAKALKYGQMVSVATSPAAPTAIPVDQKTRYIKRTSMSALIITGGACLSAVGTVDPGGAMQALTATVVPSANGSCPGE